MEKSLLHSLAHSSEDSIFAQIDSSLQREQSLKGGGEESKVFQIWMSATQFYSNLKLYGSNTNCLLDLFI